MPAVPSRRVKAFRRLEATAIGPGLELLAQLGLVSPEFLPEQVAEQVVVVVPLALPVQRNTQRD
jgi:hypothetical protein